MKKYVNIEDYEKDWNSLFKRIFGKEAFSELNKAEIKAFDFKYLNNTYPKDYDSLKELFSSQTNIDYHTERGRKALSFLFMTAFYYGMQGSYEWKVKPLEESYDTMRPLINRLIGDAKDSGVKIEI